MADIDLTTKNGSDFRMKPVKADGSPGEIDPASVVVTISDEATIRVVNLVTTNELISGRVEGAHPGVDAQFFIDADADLGPGVSTIHGVSKLYSVTTDPADLATTFVIETDPPTPNP